MTRNIGITIPIASASVHQRLFKRFYRNGVANLDKAASSHWTEFSKNFHVRSVDNDFEANGYGFGSSGNSGLFARFSAWAANTLHLSYLSLPGLRQDVRDAKAVVARMGLAFSLDAFRQTCTLNLLASHLSSEGVPERIWIIGDGHGILSALFHHHYPTARIFLADLGSVLFFQAYHLRKAYPDASQVLIDGENKDGAGGYSIFAPLTNWKPFQWNRSALPSMSHRCRKWIRL